MALSKPITQADGVTTAYHRILLLQACVNHHNSIAVISYVDETARENELNNTLAQPYQRSATYELPYDESMTVKSAYEYLKTLPDFAGAEDV